VARRSSSASSDRSVGPQRARIAELEEQLSRERRAGAALREVAIALGAPLDLDNLLELILARAAELLDADRATLYLTEDTSGDLVSRHVVGGKVQTIRLPVGRGIAGSVVQSGRSARVRDAYQDGRFDPSWDAATGYRTGSALVCPMNNHLGRTLGALQVLNKKRGGGFTADDEALLSSLATQAAICIDNVRLYLSLVHKNVQLREAQEQLEHKVAVLKLLFDLESAMARASSERELAGAVLAESVRACRVAAGALLLAHETPPPPPALYVFRAGAADPISCKRAEAVLGAIGTAAREGKELAIERLPSSPEPAADDQRELGFAVRSVLAVPLVGEDGTRLGALALYDRTDGQPFADDDRELARLVAVNVTTAISLQAARDARVTSERLSTIGRLLSGVLHDLKTPMTVIVGYVQMLSMTEDAKLRAEYSELVLKQFEHITAMQREVLAFARGERSLFLSRVYLSKFCDELRAQVEREIQGRSIQLHMDVQDRSIARFDEGKMTRALHNLVRNAIEALGDAGGRLSIQVRRDGEDLVFEVGDSGPGIPAEIEGNLFKSFVTARKAGGTGLGLAIVKKVVEEHGGTVSVASSAQGAMFTLRIPQREEG
jgi:signal transduction histidine kinase/putative methionine-R-sulfoxide reductase with GAF domain